MVGARTSVQDNCVVHVGGWAATIIGEEVTVGHGAKFESCTIGDRSVVGMNAVILQEARIGRGSLVAANSVVLEGSQVPPSSLVAGIPGKVRKTLEGSAAEFVRRSAAHYVDRGKAYRTQGIDMEERCELCGGATFVHGSKVVCLGCGSKNTRADP